MKASSYTQGSISFEWRHQMHPVDWIEYCSLMLSPILTLRDSVSLSKPVTLNSFQHWFREPLLWYCHLTDFLVSLLDSVESFEVWNKSDIKLSTEEILENMLNLMELRDCSLFSFFPFLGEGAKFSPPEVIWVGQISSRFTHMQFIQSGIDLLHVHFC